VHNLGERPGSRALSLIAGADIASVAAVLKEYPGLEHRLEFVRKRTASPYINDSKGTNVGAVVKSVEGFTHPVILIAGGSTRKRFQPALQSLCRKGETAGSDRQGSG